MDEANQKNFVVCVHCTKQADKPEDLDCSNCKIKPESLSKLIDDEKCKHGIGDYDYCADCFKEESDNMYTKGFADGEIAKLKQIEERLSEDNLKALIGVYDNDPNHLIYMIRKIIMEQ